MMLKHLLKQQAAVHFIDGGCVSGGTLEEIEDTFIKYKDEYEMLYIPLSAIRYVAVDTKERDKAPVGFTAS
ncbi:MULTISPECIES: hypothetical protein [Paenibacillus]|uniref:Uncharacterized protein n=3 Tax=Paenibacillus TaxID=44249 RepID=G4HA00_9BACL|nr:MULTISPECIES: hypothetical protein [Paenibacillus]EHB68685.1 hypothetical protein PaelaDRAFT_0811 [Paenibacillus lactis 154]MBP1893285.1 hypothetical protein [Paenibacillus lactis]MCM3496396.1 hypothetical protein [Paenibacillus lactis]